VLQLLALLESRRYWAGEELAGRQGVSVRTLRRDVEHLRELGYPVGAARGISGGYHLAPGSAIAPLLLTEEEAVAIAQRLRHALDCEGCSCDGATVDALTKIMTVLPSALYWRVDPVTKETVPGQRRPSDGVRTEILTALRRACRDRELMRIRYRTQMGSAAQYDIEPHDLLLATEHWQVHAYVRTEQAWRVLRLDQVIHAAASGTHFRPREPPGQMTHVG